MSQIPREFIDLLLARIDLVDLINTHIPLKKKSGSNYFARCPFHSEKSASFSVSQPKQFFYCFGCGAHGNAIDFLMQHDHLNFPEAIEALARTAGLEIPQTAGAPAPKKDESIPALYDLVAEVTTEYYEQLKETPRAIDYLKNRGITGKIAQQFQIGYAPAGWSHISDKFGKTDADKKKLLDVGLTIKKDGGGYYDRFRDRIMFPIHDYRGRIIGFGGRVLDTGEPKYLNSPETPLFQKGHELYGLFEALKINRQLDYALIVEGYMDVIALFQHGITQAMATLGTATSAHHLRRLYRYTSDIIFCFDGDQAGRTAAWRALQVVFPEMQDSIQIRFLFLPDGEDPDSLVRKEGKDAFEKRVTKATSLSDFFFQTIIKECDLSSMEGRARLAAMSLNHIRQLPAGIFQGIMIDELARRARVDASELRQQIRQTGTSTPQNIPVTPAPQPSLTKAKLPASVRIALSLLVQNPTLVNEINDPLPDLDIPGYLFLKDLVNIIKSNPVTTTGALIEVFRDRKEADFITMLASLQQMTPDSGMIDEFKGAIQKMANLGIENEINRLLAKAAQDGLSDKEKVELSTWIAQKKTIKAIV